MFSIRLIPSLVLLVVTMTPCWLWSQSEHIYLINADDEVKLTGFRVRGTKGIVTALHGVLNAETIMARSDTEPILREPLKIVSVDVRRDLAILSSGELETKGGDDGLDVARNINWEALGKVTIIGYPIGIELKQIATSLEVRKNALDALENLVDNDSRRELENRKSPDLTVNVLSLQGDVLPGHSGAPILDSQNRILAVANGGLRGGLVGHAWAIPIRNAQWKSAKSDPALAVVQQMDVDGLFKFDRDPPPAEALKTLDANQMKMIADLQAIRRDLKTGRLLGLMSDTSRLSLKLTDLSRYHVRAMEVAADMKRLLNDLESQIQTTDLPLVKLQVRIAQATVANIEERYRHTLKLVTRQDVESKYKSDVLEVRGHAFFGLRRWEDALACYEQIRQLLPSNIDAALLGAACRFETGAHDAAISELDALISHYQREGPKPAHARALFIRGVMHARLQRRAQMARDHNRAIGIYENLVAHDKQYQGDLAEIIAFRGRILAGLGVSSALNDLQYAVDTVQRLVNEGKTEYLAVRANAVNNLGNGHRIFGQYKRARLNYEEAVSIFKNLVQGQERLEFEQYLALSYHNLGTVLGDLRQLKAADQALSEAVDIYRRKLIREDYIKLEDGLAWGVHNRGIVRGQLNKLKQSINDLAEAVRIRRKLVRIGELDSTRLAESLMSHAYALRLDKQLSQAIKSYEEAICIQTRLVDDENRMDAEPALGIYLNRVAWILSTSQDHRVRDGAKAVVYATRACEITRWRDEFVLETLAASHAESGDFHKAVEYQKKALERAQVQRPELRERLEKYRRNEPYRQ